MVMELQGGEWLKVDPNRLKLHPNAHQPMLRLGSPGTLITNSGSTAQLNECSERQLGVPVPSHAVVLLYKMNPDIYIVVSPTQQTEGDDVYELRIGKRTPIIRGLKDLFASHQIPLQTDLWYEMKSEIATVDGLGLCVVANWTKATTRLRTEGEAGGDEPDELEELEELDGKAAAGEQTEGQPTG